MATADGRCPPTYRQTLNILQSRARHAACDVLAKGRECPVSGQRANVYGALVAITPEVRDRAPTRGDGRPSADFVAHLIATAVKMPQTCVRRRAGEREAVAAYAAADQAPASLGRALSRSL
jgi:hypothetical protein